MTGSGPRRERYRVRVDRPGGSADGGIAAGRGCPARFAPARQAASANRRRALRPGRAPARRRPTRRIRRAGTAASAGTGGEPSHLRIHQRRVGRKDTDAGVLQLEPEALGEPVQAPLGSGVPAGEWTGAQTRRRQQVDDRAVAPRAHLGEQRTGERDRRHQIGLQLLADRLVGHVHQIGEHQHAGVVHEDVGRVAGGQHIARQSGGLVRVGEVGRPHDRPLPERFDLGPDGLEGGPIAGHQGQAAAAGREPKRQGAPDAARRAGDERMLSGQLHAADCGASGARGPADQVRSRGWASVIPGSTRNPEGRLPTDPVTPRTRQDRGAG